MRRVITRELWLDRLGEWYIPEPNTGCYLWARSNGASKYGYVISGGKDRRVHRLAYELLVGPIPDGLTIDHLCRQPCCVNVEHMEVVTFLENNRRGCSPSASNLRKTHCKHGHEFTPENTRLCDGGTQRHCRECQRIYARDHRESVRRSIRNHYRRRVGLPEDRPGERTHYTDNGKRKLVSTGANGGSLCST